MPTNHAGITEKKLKRIKAAEFLAAADNFTAARTYIHDSIAIAHGGKELKGKAHH